MYARPASAESRAFLTAASAPLGRFAPVEVASLAERHAGSHLARIVGAMFRCYERARGDEGGGLDTLELVRREQARQREAAGADLRRGLTVLATTGSIAPFVGLLGTVIGIITAFQTIASSGSGGLGAISAGIAEALIVTAFGLAVAIPAVLLFNALSARIQGLELALDRGVGQISDLLENEHGRKRSNADARQAA